MNHDYPGNIRELENAVEHGVVMCRGGIIQPEDLPDYFIEQLDSDFTDDVQHGKGAKLSALEFEEMAIGSYTDAMQSFEQKLIMNALQKAQGNQSAAARAMGISERKLRYRIQILGIENTFRAE